MNILFISHHDFRCNSLTHIAGFTEGLQQLGHVCAVAVPNKPHTISAVPRPAFVPVTYRDLRRNPKFFPDGRPADIIHAWTPRQHVADCVIAYQRQLQKPARLIIHLEDNEEHLASSVSGLPFAELRLAPPRRWNVLKQRQLIHPWKHALFLHAADAITHITPTLAKFIPAGRHSQLLLPGVNPDFFTIQAPDTELRAKLGVTAQTKLIVYCGGANPINAGELQDLYRAVVLLNTPDCQVRLIRTGASPKWFLEQLTPEEHLICIDLGFVERSTIPRLMSLADVLVQPGRRGPFNDYRLPSKLAEFLASGKPVIMPGTNIAAELVDGRDALFLQTGTPEEIANLCQTVFNDAALARLLGQNARKAASRLFDANRQSDTLADLYANIVNQPQHVAWHRLADPRLDERALFTGGTKDPALSAALAWVEQHKSPWWKRLFSRVWT